MILVTGGSGFIGNNLMKELGDDGLNWDVKVGRDIFSQDIVEAVQKCKAIVHLAALSSGELSKEQPKLTYQINFKGTLEMLLLAESFKKKVIFASSAAVYADNGMTASRETDELNSMTPYGLSKIDAEYACASFRRHIPIVVLRLFNVYGEGQNPNYAGVITNFLNQMKNGVLTVYGDGNQTRDFISVKDVCKVIKTAIEDERLDGQIFNVGTGRATSINELAAIFKNNNKKILRVHHDKERDEIRHSGADTRIFKSLYKEPLETDLSEDLKKMIKEQK